MVEKAFNVLMQGLQARIKPVSEKMLLSQYHGQEKKRRAAIEAIDPDGWIVLARLRAGSATGRVFWDACDLVIMAPAADVAARRFDRCVLLSG
ncbi:hypothetical protein [Rhizobium leguminosarum]|uniref:Uncharacterized protein n=1 Tax=Rhizobium leguminosarum TaxID=384 RepID=A0A7K3VE43_RHILE|nr:hypothetical protein [Rhizobium leguminosarum]NEK15087.1 hypothetical protein [Rhizobium leguminosarum]